MNCLIVDPVTKKFLVNYCDPVFGYPQLVRFSWSTAENALEETSYHVEWEKVGESDKNKVVANNSSITSFFKMTKNQNEEKKEHEFFTNRCLTRKVEL